MTVTSSRHHRRTLVVCFGLPAALLAACYAWLSVDRGTPLLWNVVVHESGRYTLGGTVFYFSHFLREIPTVLAYSLFLLGVSGGHAIEAVPARGRSPVLGAAALVLAASLPVLAVVMTAGSAGWDSAFRDLLQFRTRDDMSAYGSHWRFHWLSTLWFGAGALAVAVLQPGARRFRIDLRWMVAAWCFFLLATLVFGLSWDIFLDPRYVGHQAREILTHGPVTALLGLGVVYALSPRPTRTEGRDLIRGRDGGDAPVSRSVPGGSRVPRGLVWVVYAVFLLIPIYLATVGLLGDALAEGQTGGGLAPMVAAHYFEHSLDYLFVVLLLIGVLSIRRPRPPHRP